MEEEQRTGRSDRDVDTVRCAHLDNSLSIQDSIRSLEDTELVGTRNDEKRTVHVGDVVEVHSRAEDVRARDVVTSAPERQILVPRPTAITMIGVPGHLGLMHVHVTAQELTGRPE